MPCRPPHADLPKILTYLGTYFPRSFVESCTIVSELLGNRVIRDAISSQRRISILDIGAGTGGELFGLLWALYEAHIGDSQEMSAVCIDSNSLALQKQAEVFSLCRQASGDASSVVGNLEPQMVSWEFNTPESLEIAAESLPAEWAGGFDVILSSKFVSELYMNPSTGKPGYYAAFLSAADSMLAKNGVLVLIDVTVPVQPPRGYKGPLNKDIRGRYLPKLLNRETRQYSQSEHAQLKQLVPLSCAYFGEQCSTGGECFHRRTMHVSHSRCEDDDEGVAYKVFTKSDLANRSLSSYRTSSPTAYRIAAAQPPKWKPGMSTSAGKDEYCYHGEHFTPDALPRVQIRDAFEAPYQA